MINPCIYIFVNKSLKMSAGKLASQTAHATAQMFTKLPSQDLAIFWAKEPHRTIIVLEARDEAHIRNINNYLNERGIDCDLVIDEGANEVPPHSITALVTPILDKNEFTDKLMSTFKLYKEETLDSQLPADRWIVGPSQPLPFLPITLPRGY